jgi:hypothetical protein
MNEMRKRGETMFVLPTQPMTFMDAVRNSFQLWWMTLASVLPLNIISALLSGWPIFFEKFGISTEAHHSLVWILVFLISVINLIPYSAIVAMIGHAAHGQPIKISQGFATSLMKLPSTVSWLMIILGLIGVMVGMLLGGSAFISSSTITTPGAILFSGAMLILIFIMVYSIYTICVFPLIILENQSVLEAVKRSLVLTKGQWLYGGTLISIIISFSVILNFATEFMLGNMGSILISCFFISLNASVIIIFYEHLKRRVAQ